MLECHNVSYNQACPAARTESLFSLVISRNQEQNCNFSYFSYQKFISNSFLGMKMPKAFTSYQKIQHLPLNFRGGPDQCDSFHLLGGIFDFKYWNIFVMTSNKNLGRISKSDKSIRVYLLLSNFGCGLTDCLKDNQRT